MHLAILLALLAAEPQAELRVLDAVYGNPDRGRMCDATAQIASQCDGRTACVIAVSNGMCGDPDFGTPKHLVITFKCGPFPAQVVAVAETQVIRLGCGALPEPAPRVRPAPATPASPSERTAFHTPPRH